MVVVEYLYSDMKKLVDLPLSKMVEGLSELGAPSEYEEETKKIITELTPNRPDWYSMEGLARSLRAHYSRKHPSYEAKKSDYRVVVDPSVARIRPYTACAVIRGLKLNDQRITDMVLLQEKLLGTLGRRVKKFGIGIYPLGGISFPVRYTTMKPEEIQYVPLGHEKPMSAREIIETHKKGQQYGHLIKGFSRYPVFVDDEGKIMALIPVVNSAETGKVGVDTKDVFIEVTGNDLNACKAALNIMVCTFADMGGTVHEVRIECGKEAIVTPDLRPKKLRLRLQDVNKTLGVALGEKEAAGLLQRMGYGYAKGEVVVPPYRADVLSWVDIMEDIAVAYGYNNFKPTLPDFFFPGAKAGGAQELDAVMRGMGFLEAKTFILTNKENLSRSGYEGGAMNIENPCSEEYTLIRPNLVSSALEILVINKMKGLPQKFYEIGIAHDGKKMRKKLVFCIADKTLEFSGARGYLQSLIEETGLRFSLEKKKIKTFDPELSCVIIIDGKEKGIFGKVNKGVLGKFGLGFDAYLCELDLD